MSKVVNGTGISIATAVGEITRSGTNWQVSHTYLDPRQRDAFRRHFDGSVSPG